MLSFIPMNKKATVYKADQSQLDKWGKPTVSQGITRKCQILYNTDINRVSGMDGYETTISATIVFHGYIDVVVGDYVEFKIENGKVVKVIAKDVYYFEDWAGKIVSTRVVVANGKRS